MHKLLYKLTAKLPYHLIKLGDKPYLERYYVGQLFGVTFYLHHFVSGDSERHLHNHPWGWGRALVLCGNYLEERVTDLCPQANGSGCLIEERRVRWWNKVNGNHFHRIKAPKPNTWTLFFHGERTRINLGHCSMPKGWGFLERHSQGDQKYTVFTPHQSAASKWWETAPTRET